MPAAAVAPVSGRAQEQPQEEAPKVLVPFVRAAREHEEPFHDTTTAMGAAAVQVGPVDVPAFGYLRHLLVKVTLSGGSAGMATVAEYQDAPWNVLQNLMLTDVNGAPIVGPITGYDLYLIDKYGGYSFDTDPANSPVYSAPDDDGDFTFLLRVPVEIAGRDALGALPNQNAASTYKLHYQVAASGTVFSTPPDTLGNVRVQCWLEAWAQPQPTDLRGNPQATVPPAIGTTQYWSKFTEDIASGANTNRLVRVGNLIRTLIFVWRNDASPAVREGTEFPDPVQIHWDGRIVRNLGRDIWQHLMRERYGFAPDTGVWVLDLTHDLDYHPGNEMRDLYFPTTQASRLEVQGTFGGAGTLDVITNDVAPAGDVYVE